MYAHVSAPMIKILAALAVGLGLTLAAATPTAAFLLAHHAHAAHDRAHVERSLNS